MGRGGRRGEGAESGRVTGAQQAADSAGGGLDGGGVWQSRMLQRGHKRDLKRWGGRGLRKLAGRT